MAAGIWPQSCRSHREGPKLSDFKNVRIRTRLSGRRVSWFAIQMASKVAWVLNQWPIIVTPNQSDSFIVTFIQSIAVTSIRANPHKQNLCDARDFSLATSMHSTSSVVAHSAPNTSRCCRSARQTYRRSHCRVATRDRCVVCS